ncbi:CDP-alcohol phosphatidyltransferase family protein [Halobaculum sp. MBLA0147]|uniref:CDP-alcohol phosphatidyltransferase family protein n=1 Tax=Halobaculum sp. MBLA0147 TaxID=3079934 RepID=UPI00352332B9
MVDDPTLPRRLGRQTTVVAPGAAVVLAVGYAVVATTVDATVATHWLVAAGVTTTGVVVFLRHHLTENRPPSGGPVSRTLGLANAVTVTRGLGYAVAAGFVVVAPERLAAHGGAALLWVPAVCYGSGVVMDALDGFLARHVGERTRLGERLDLAYDTLGFVVAPAVGVAWGRLPAVYLALAAARYVYRGGLAIERRRGRPVGSLPPSRLRRPLAAFQMGFLTIALTPVVPAGAVRTVAPLALAPSLLVFGRDYLAVTGRLPRWLGGSPRGGEPHSERDGAAADD